MLGGWEGWSSDSCAGAQRESGGGGGASMARNLKWRPNRGFTAFRTADWGLGTDSACASVLGRSGRKHSTRPAPARAPRLPRLPLDTRLRPLLPLLAAGVGGSRGVDRMPREGGWVSSYPPTPPSPCPDDPGPREKRSGGKNTTHHMTIDARIDGCSRSLREPEH